MSSRRDLTIPPSDKYKKLQAELLESGKLFVDEDFPLKLKSIFHNGKAPADYLSSGYIPRNIKWQRPKDICKGFDRDPKFITRYATRFDVDQGNLGNCWFLSSMASLATSHTKHLQRVLPTDQGFDKGEYTGMFRFYFWNYGEWTEVIIDDYLPTYDGQLMFVSNTQCEHEFWPCLMEKAFAKLRGGCYYNLHSGRTEDGLVDLTGGMAEVIYWGSHAPDDSFYDLIHKAWRMKTMMGASFAGRDSDVPTQGLVGGHAYTITGFREVPNGTGMVDLIRLRNPWGEHTEWTGAWSDDSPEMKNLSSDWQSKLRFKNRADGEFWMAYPDFKSIFQEVSFCHLRPDALITELEDNYDKQDWNTAEWHKAWVSGATAGGPPDDRNPAGALFWKNPQFYISIHHGDDHSLRTQRHTVILSLTQKLWADDEDKLTIGMDIYQVKSHQAKKLIDGDSSGEFVGRFRPDYLRDATLRAMLTDGDYVIIPYSTEENEDCEFMLRIYADCEFESGISDKRTTRLKKPFAGNSVYAVFERYAGKDKTMYADELGPFIEDLSTTELHEQIIFSNETCRSIIHFMEPAQDGKLNFAEANDVWIRAKDLHTAFKVVDKDGSGFVETFELNDLFDRLNLPISRDVMEIIARRYGGRNLRVNFADFCTVFCKLDNFIGTFYKNTQLDVDTAVFDMESYLTATMAA